MYIPGHAPSLHGMLSEASPSHGDPPSLAEGLSQFRVRCLAPVPQVSVHAPQLPHAPQAPSTETTEIYLNIRSLSLDTKEEQRT